MRLRCYSDLHLEFRDISRRVEIVRDLERDADVLILAGDIVCFGDSRDDWEEVFKALCEGWDKVFYMPGNHEYYGTSPMRANLRLFEIAAGIPQLQLLGVNWEKVHIYKDQRFVGCPLWFPLKAEALPHRRMINDFNYINGFEPWVYEENKRQQAFLYGEVEPGDVVITHYMPSMQSVPLEFKGNATNYFFVCDMEELILTHRPALWIHGHSHGKVDYVLGETRVFANPVGYPGENGHLPGAGEPSLVEIGDHHDSSKSE